MTDDSDMQDKAIGPDAILGDMTNTQTIARIAIVTNAVWLLLEICVAWVYGVRPTLSDNLLASTSLGLAVWVHCIAGGLDPKGRQSRMMLTAMILLYVSLVVVHPNLPGSGWPVGPSGDVKALRYSAIEENLD